MTVIPFDEAGGELSQSVVVNARVQSSGLAGTKRYIVEMNRRLLALRPLRPKRSLNGVRAHIWEQTCLPIMARGKLLWSPATTGPLSMAAQVVTVHDLAVLDHPEWFNPRFAAWYQWLLPRLIRKVRRIVAVSSFTRDRILELGGDPARVSVIHNGIDECFYARSSEEIAFTLEALRASSPHYLLCVGSLEPRKNLSVLLEAWERVVDLLPRDLWLMIAGAEGPGHVFNTVERPASGKQVHFTGFVPENFLPALYSGAIALAFVYPSLYEGFGLPVLEAMACGTPPITGNRTSLPELVGDAGLCAEPSDPDAIGAAILRMVTDDHFRQECRRKSISRSKLFSWDRAAERISTTLLEALQEGRPD